MRLILTPCFEQERKPIWQMIRYSTHDTVKTILSMESIHVLDGSQLLTMSRRLLCSPTIVTRIVDFSDMKTGDEVIIRGYYKRRDED